jgi:hypothetical protein
MLYTMMTPSTAAKVKVASAPTADVVSVPDAETATFTGGMRRVIVTVAGVPTAETLPAASLTQGKKVWVPVPAEVTVAGAVAVHPTAPATGGVADWVIMYPVTATLSVAVNALTITDRLVAVGAVVNAVTAGAVVSRVMFTVTGVLTAETLPAPSLAQGKKVWLPAAAAVTVAGAVAVHPAAVAACGVDDWVTMKPVTPVSSVAVNELTLTVKLEAVAGRVNAVMVGGVVSVAPTVPPPPLPPPQACSVPARATETIT